MKGGSRARRPYCVHRRTKSIQIWWIPSEGYEEDGGDENTSTREGLLSRMGGGRGRHRRWSPKSPRSTFSLIVKKEKGLHGGYTQDSHIRAGGRVKHMRRGQGILGTLYGILLIGWQMQVWLIVGETVLALLMSWHWRKTINIGMRRPSLYLMKVLGRITTVCSKLEPSHR